MFRFSFKMRKDLEEPVNSQNPLGSDTLENSMSLEFNSLISCNCCDRHKINRPTHITKLYERRPRYKNKIDYICECTCRQRSRQICRDLCGSEDIYFVNSQ